MTSRKCFSQWVFCLVLVGILPLVGCGGAYSSPQATFETAKAAGKQQNWKAMYDCFSPDSLEVLAGMAAMGGSLGGDEVAAVLEKHGAKKFDPQKMQPGVTPNEMAKQLVADVSDKSQFMADMMEARGGTITDGMLKTLSDATLEDLNITGDTATANVVNSGKKSPVKFINVDGAWKFDLNIFGG